MARSFLGWSQVESGRLAEGIDTLEKQRRFPGDGASYLLAAHLSVLAGRGICPSDKLTRSQASVSTRRATLSGEAATTGTRSSACASKGGLPRIRRSMMQPRAERFFEQALALANQRGQRGFALRAALALAGHLAREGQSPTGSQVAGRRVALLRRSAGPRRPRRCKRVTPFSSRRVSKLKICEAGVKRLLCCLEVGSCNEKSSVVRKI